MEPVAKPGRNERCPCGSGRKYKLCCGAAPTRSAAATAPLPDRDVRLAAKLLREGRYAEAIAPLRQAAARHPRNPSLLSDLGLACLHDRRVDEAIGWLRRSLALRPNFAPTHFHLGTALEQSGDDEGALAAYQRALALNPTLAEAQARIAEFLLAKGLRAEAAEAFDRAAATSGDTTSAGIRRAKALLARGRSSDAEVELQTLILRDPACAEAHQMLGNILTEAGRFDEAARHLTRSIALLPRQAAAYHTLVLSRRVTEQDRGLVARMLAEIDAGGLTEPQRMTLHFAIGKALDDLGDHAGAMSHFEAANEIRRRTMRFDRADFARRLDHLIERFTAAFFADNAALGCADDTPILVLGMPRSGTTLVERILSSHAEIAGGGELEFWNQRGPLWVAAAIPEIFVAAPGLAADYRAVLRGVASAAPRVTDKMPFNFLWLGLVHLLFPNARIVHCRRNPIDTCLSIYTMQFSSRWAFAGGRGDLVFYYRQYLRLMAHWRQVVPADRLLEIDYEEITGAPEAAARRLIAFCGLDWDPACLQPEQNRDAVRTASLWQARQPIYRHSVERWRRYEPWLGELRELSPG
jgi:tetratricopeptide (TPR) repeat protein